MIHNRYLIFFCDRYFLDESVFYESTLPIDSKLVTGSGTGIMGDRGGGDRGRGDRGRGDRGRGDRGGGERGRGTELG